MRGRSLGMEICLDRSTLTREFHDIAYTYGLAVVQILFCFFAVAGVVGVCEMRHALLSITMRSVS